MKVSPTFVYKLFVSFVFVGVLFGANHAYAVTTYGSLTYHTLGYGASNEWNAVGGDQIVAANDNDADWSYITVNTLGKAETYTFSTPTLPPGAVLNGVSLYIFAKKMDVSDDGITDPANDPQVSLRVENGSNPTHVSDDLPVTISNDGTYHLYSRHMMTNPITGSDWTLADLTSGALRYGIVRTNEGSETGIEPRITALWVDVNYSIESTSTATSTDGGSGGSGGSGGGSGSGSSTSTNTTPTANAQTITTPVNVSATTTLTGTDTDIPAQTLTYTIATTTTNGTTTLVGNVVTYVPNAGFVGTDTLTFVVSDGIATSTPATVTITVGTPSSGGGSGSGGGSSSSSSGGSGGSGGGSSSSGGGSSSSSGGGYFVNANGQPVSGGGSGSPQGQVLGASSTCGIYMTKYTRNGYKNDVETVKKLQMFLNSYLKVSIPVTGYFGPITERYVKVLQSRHQDVMLMPWKITTPSGLSYITTVVGINNIVCPDLKLPIPTNLIEWSKNSGTPEKIR
jgi:hypothetical protein